MELLGRLDDFEAMLPLSKDIEVEVGDYYICDWFCWSLNRDRALLGGSLIEERFSSVCSIMSSVVNLWLERCGSFLEAILELIYSEIFDICCFYHCFFILK